MRIRLGKLEMALIALMAGLAGLMVWAYFQEGKIVSECEASGGRMVVVGTHTEYYYLYSGGKQMGPYFRIVPDHECQH